ncbi:MAG: ATP-binding protein, partial [Chloroflexi bacterium]|nr:ATP-binding protein [Chloroflexota bacterium]
MVLDTLLIYLLGKIADKALDEALKQGFHLAKNAVEGKFPSKISLTGGLFLPKSQLVNMEKELRAIKQALAERSQGRLLYVRGEGGVGKTRLLEESAKITQSATGILWGGLIDLYHSNFHSAPHLQKTIANNLDPKDLYFKKYRQFQAEFERKRSSGISTANELDELEDVFLADYNLLASAKRIALAFDTLEKIDDEYDLVQQIEASAAAGYTIQRWLLRFCANAQNTTIIMAGRPAPALQKRFESDFSQPGRFEIIQLDGLGRVDTRQLLKIYAKQGDKTAVHLDAYADALWDYTKGAPAHLAMTVELSKHVADAVRANPEGKINSEQFSREMIETFFNYQDP